MYYEYDEYEHFNNRCVIIPTTSNSSDISINIDWFEIQDECDEWLAPYEEFLETLE